MGFGFASELHRYAWLLIVGMAAVVLGGCQHQSEPLRLTVISDQASPASADGTFVNPTWREDDDISTNFVFEAWDASTSALGSVFNPIGELAVRGFQRMNGEGTAKADRMLEDASSPDNRREGMNELAEFGLLNDPIFLKRCRQLAERDSDPGVRATAIRTCNRAHDMQATTVFIAGLADQSDWVKLEAAKALTNLPDVRASDALQRMVEDRTVNRDVRVAATDALKHYRTLATARVLSSALEDKSFVICWQARRSLRYLTNRDFGYDGTAWLNYFISPESQLR